MKIFYVLFFAFALLANPLFATTVDSLKQVARKSNRAADWNAVAEYYFEQNDTAQVKQSAQRALQLGEQENNPAAKADALTYLAELDYMRGNWGEYERKYKTALEYAKAGDSPEILSCTLNNLADFYQTVGQYDDALKLFNEALSIEKNPRLVVALYNNISLVFVRKGMEDSCFFYTGKALNAATQVKDTTAMCESYAHFAIMYKRKNQYRKALEYYQESLRLSELSNDIEMHATTCHNIAVIYMEWGKHKEALAFARKAVRDHTERRLDINLLGNALTLLGRVLLADHQYTQAIDTLKRALSLTDETPGYALYTLLNLSSCYFELNRLDSCEACLHQVKELIDANEELPREEYYMVRGVLLVRQNKFKEAIPALLKGEELAAASGRSKVKNNTNLYNNLALAYEKGLHDYQKALYYKNRAYDLQDSIYKQENNDMMADFSVRYETAEKELEISRLNGQQQKMALQRMYIIGGAVLLAALLLVVVIYNRALRLRKEKEAALLAKRIEEKETEYQLLLHENERQQMQSYLEGLEAERNRISAELHDNVANEVFLINMELEKAGRLPAAVSARLGDLHARVRTISHELASPAFHHVSLPEILTHYASRLRETSGLQVALEMDGRDALAFLPEELSGEIYRIVQETAGNAVKHGHAHQLKITLSAKDNQLNLCVADDGVGFDAGKPHAGIGLQIVKRRCNALHGALRIDSGKGKGTVVCIAIPYSIQP